MPHRIWFLEGEKLGDNAQVLAILDALGVPWQAPMLQPPTFKAAIS